MAVRYSSLIKPQGTWWHSLGRDEKLWVGLVVIWGLAMFVMISFVWPLVGSRQNDIQSFRITPAEFTARAEAFTAANKVGELGGIPVVAPKPGEDVYLEAISFAWRPIVQLKKGQTYRLLMSSRDVQHGFSLIFTPRSLNYQVLPGYVSAVLVTPDRSGDYPIVCNEYCGVGHHIMLGRIIVTD